MLQTNFRDAFSVIVFKIFLESSFYLLCTWDGIHFEFRISSGHFYLTQMNSFFFQNEADILRGILILNYRQYTVCNFIQLFIWLNSVLFIFISSLHHLICSIVETHSVDYQQIFSTISINEIRIWLTKEVLFCKEDQILLENVFRNF